jgi:uncharacterized protein (DUF1810 family)
LVVGRGYFKGQMRKALGTLIAGLLMFLGAICALLWVLRRADATVLIVISAALALFVMIMVHREPDNPMLERFIQAQDKTYAGALAELKAGRKRGHWIWWVFPQMRGLGTSEYSVFYGIANEAEAMAYLSHPVLGARYRECVSVVHGHLCQGRVDPLTLMGSEIDVLKLRSSLEIFLKVTLADDKVLSGQVTDILNVLG